MASLNTATSIVDYLKSTGADSSFSSRSNLAVQYGIVKNASDYLGSAEQNTALLSKVSASGKPANVPTPSTSTPVPPTATPTPTQTPQASATTASDAHAIINGSQATDQKQAATTMGGGEPPIRTSAQSLIDTYSTIAKTLTPSTPAPSAPNLTATYSALRGAYGIDTLESDVNKLNAQAQQLKSQLYSQQLDEQGKPVAMNVIEGRMTEEQRVAAQKLQPLLDEIKIKSDMLTTKYNTINSIMQYTNTDYTNAKSKYDTEYSQNLQMFNVVKGVSDTNFTQEEALRDDARANAQIIVNSVTSNGSTLSSADPSVKANLAKLEVQAGLPQGFFESLQVKNPKGTILSTTTREANGGKYADVIYKNNDGSLSTQSVYLGSADSSSDKPTEAETKRKAISSMSTDLAKQAGADGYVSPDTYKEGKKAWVKAGFDSANYDSAFSAFVNPDHKFDYGLK